MDEKRNHPRHRTLKTGHIVFNDARSTIDCVIRNQSDHGAMLRVASAVGIPERFQLRLIDRSLHQAQIVWRSTTDIGVTLAD